MTIQTKIESTGEKKRKIIFFWWVVVSNEFVCIFESLNQTNMINIPMTIEIGVYFYIDDETGKPVFDTDSMTQEFERKVQELETTKWDTNE
jgi:hypothetical protein